MCLGETFLNFRRKTDLSFNKVKIIYTCITYQILEKKEKNYKIVYA